MGVTLPTETGIPYRYIVVLALLAIPRMVVHDLQLLSFNSIGYRVLAIGPFLVWLGFAVFYRTDRPLTDFLILGTTVGIFLGITHMVLWNASFERAGSTLGGNLEGVFSPLVENAILRIAGFISSLVTGVALGVIFGVIAFISAKARNNLK